MATESDEIQIPSADGEIGAQLSDKQLLSMQDGLYKSKQERRKAQRETQPLKEATPDAVKEEAPVVPEPKAKKDPATEIFERTQNLGDDVPEEKPKAAPKKKKEAAPKEDDAADGEEGFISPDVPDFSEFAEPKAPEGEKKVAKPEAAPEGDVNLDKEDNIKNLRTIAGKFKKELETEKAERERLAGLLNQQPNQSALTTKISDLEKRVAELEPFEMVYGLHNNPQFRGKYIEGAKQIEGEIGEIAKDYGVDESIVQEILATTNRKELDEIVSDAFSSDAARQDVKALKQRYDGLHKERKEFEKKPKEALEQFEQQKVLSETQRNQQRNTHFETVIQSGWATALAANESLDPEARLPELMEIPGKKNHNEKVARPTLEAANKSTQMGLEHIERMIRKGSLIDKSFATWFAGLCQSAAATQMTHLTRMGLHQKLVEIEGKNKKQDSFDNPSINSPARNGTPPVSREKKTGKERAADIFQQVQSEYPDA